MKLRIDDQPLSLQELRAIWESDVEVTIGSSAKDRITRSAAVINKVLAHGDQVYGVNTGFGQLAQVKISNDDLAKLQVNLVLSHAVGTGPLLPDPIVRLTMVMKIAALAQGFSGARLKLVNGLCVLLKHKIYPCIPSKGSVGASGDLAPLAHMAGALIGIGDVRVNGKKIAAKQALADAGLEALELAPKEGLALLNGTQVSTALALAALFRCEHVLSAAMAAGAMAADAIKGSDTPFDDRIHQIRGHAGQADVASLLRELMQGSEIRASHIDCVRVQDP